MKASKIPEEIGSFFLGHRHDTETGTTHTDEPILYDAKDLTTHAVCIGMTGSGKTGLCISLLEEAAIDGVPIIAIDPKGDLANLLLTFPKLRGQDFLPWIDEGEATRAGRTREEHAAAMAEVWRSGLAASGQSPTRIGRFARAAERVVYTPGSTSGRPLSVLRALTAPKASLLEDADGMRDRLIGATSGLLGLLGITADPLRSREHILVQSILDHSWRAGQDVDLPSLIRAIQKPPFERVGVMDLESFFPAGDRLGLAMTLNNLIASPGFAAWTQGEPLDVGRLLYAADGRPRLSIISIAHLSDSERMFMVTYLLNEVVAWMRTQPGSRTLRALLYMDEVMGFLPPGANPPSKTPMLTLLKQARAFGIGTVLATQNPVDLDYKALSNSGTWFLGRLQTERDKARVLDGLEGATVGARDGFDRAEMERTLSGMPKRVFLMHNVHEDRPALMHTRFALSYLAGPLTRAQIGRLDGTKSAPEASPGRTPAAARKSAPAGREPQKKAPSAAPMGPPLPAGIDEVQIDAAAPSGSGKPPEYVPHLLGRAVLHHANARLGLDQWTDVAVAAPFPKRATTSPWEQGHRVGSEAGIAPPDDDILRAALPSMAGNQKHYTRWQKMLARHLHRHEAMTLWKSRKPRLVAEPGETEAEFRGRVRDTMREERDLKIEKLRRKYAPRLSRLEDRLRKAEQTVEVQKEQYSHSRTQTVVSIGSTLLGALFGRKSGAVRRAATTVGRASRASKEKADIERAAERVEMVQRQLQEMTERLEDEIAGLPAVPSPADVDIDEVRVAPRKSDLDVQTLRVAWVEREEG